MTSRVPGRTWLERFVRGVGFLTGTVGLGLGSWLGSYWTHYGVNRPVVPDPASGRVVPLRFRSVVVFVTQSEGARIETLQTWVLVTCGVLAGTIVLSEVLRLRGPKA